MVDAVFLKALCHLGGKFARRREDERSRHTGARASRFQPCDHGQHEGRGLAGARLGDSEHVAPSYSDGNGFRLDWCRRLVAGGIDGRLHLGAEIKLSEGFYIQKSTSPSAFIPARANALGRQRATERRGRRIRLRRQRKENWSRKGTKRIASPALEPLVCWHSPVRNARKTMKMWRLTAVVAQYRNYRLAPLGAHSL